MIKTNSPLLIRYPTLPLALYCAMIVGCALTTAFSITHVVEQYGIYGESLSRLTRLQQRPAATSDARAAPRGESFLEGNTATVASAALLQRVTAAVSSAGGIIISSEVEQGGVPSKDGYLKVVTNFEMPQASLQRVLHDLEAGMPFLFVEQLLVQTGVNSAKSAQLRVRLAVSGFWIAGRR